MIVGWAEKPALIVQVVYVTAYQANFESLVPAPFFAGNKINAIE